MLQTCISHYKNLGVLLLLAAVVGNGHGSQNVSTPGPGTATPTATAGHNHSFSWTSQAANTTGLHFNSSTDKDRVSNGTTAAVTMSRLGSTQTSQLTSVTAGGSFSADIPRTTDSTAIPKRMSEIVLGLLILLFLMAVIVLLIVVIWCLHKKTRQYSFDLNHKEDADIPLSSVGQGGVFAPNQNDEKPADFEYVAKDESGVAPGESELQAGEERRGPEDGRVQSMRLPARKVLDLCLAHGTLLSTKAIVLLTSSHLTVVFPPTERGLQHLHTLSACLYIK